MLLADVQARFAGALLDPHQLPPPEVVGRNGRPAGRRFDVYRNNVIVGLVNALRAAYPAVERIVGTEFFTAMARVFVRDHLPDRPILIQYGGGFPEFLEVFEPVARHPYLADVARIERARLLAYHAADAAPLAPGRLARLAPDALAGTGFRAHPAADVVRSRFPAVTVWSMNAGILQPAPLDFDIAEDALVTRATLNVEVRLLRPGGAVFFLALRDGARLGEAAVLGEEAAPGFDLAATLSDCLAAGAFSAVDAP